MKNFTYVAKDTAGKTQKGVIEAENGQEVLQKIHEQGWFCVSYNENLGSGRKSIYKFSTKELAFICRQMSAMMTSGLTIVKALDILYREQEKPAAKQTLLDVYEAVQKGTSFTEALEEKDSAFPDFFVSMVSAGESSGSLDVVMTRLSDHYADENKLNNKIKGAMTYPIILGILCIVMVIGMFTFILPTFASMAAPEDIPALSKALFGFSDFLKSYWYVVIIIVLGIVAGIYFALKVDSVRLKFDKLKLTAPSVGKLVGKVYVGRFARTLSSLYSSGIPMVECLERSSKVLGNKYIDQCFVQIIDEVKQGHPLSTSIQKTEVFESMFCSIVYVGEESGALDEILEKTAGYYEEEADSAITKIVGMMEPLMIIIMGVAICLCLVAIFPLLYQNMDDM